MGEQKTNTIAPDAGNRWVNPVQRFLENGGDDGTRTRDLCRDKYFQRHRRDGAVSHWKYIIGMVIVYRDVYRAAFARHTQQQRAHHALEP